MNLALSRTTGIVCQMHVFAVDAIHAIDACNVEQFRAVRISLDVQLLVGFFAGIICILVEMCSVPEPPRKLSWPPSDRARRSDSDAPNESSVPRI